MKSSVNKIILGCFILFIGCIHFTTGTRICDANTRANYQSRMPPQLKQHLVNAEAEKIMPKCLMMQFKIACSECDQKRTDAEFDHCLLLQRSQSQQMVDANPQLKQICMEETMAAVSEKMRNARQSNQFDEFNEDEYDQFDEFGATRTCDESAMRNFISTMTPAMRQKNAPALRMAPKCSMMGFEIACSRCNTEDTDADYYRCLYSQEGKISSPELWKTCNAEIMAYQMKQHGRSLRSRRSLDAAPFFSGHAFDEQYDGARGADTVSLHDGNVNVPLHLAAAVLRMNMKVGTTVTGIPLSKFDRFMKFAFHVDRSHTFHVGFDAKSGTHVGLGVATVRDWCNDKFQIVVVAKRSSNLQKLVAALKKDLKSKMNPSKRCSRRLRGY